METAGGGAGELRSHREEHSNRGAEGKAERFLHRGLVPTSTHQPERLVCSPTGVGGGWELRLGLRSVGSQGEDWGWLHEHSLKGASAPWLAGRESRKKSAAAEEARDFVLPLCFLVHEERGLRAPLKGAPEMGASCGYQRRPQRRA